MYAQSHRRSQSSLRLRSQLNHDALLVGGKTSSDQTDIFDLPGAEPLSLARMEVREGAEWDVRSWVSLQLFLRNQCKFLMLLFILDILKAEALRVVGEARRDRLRDMQRAMLIVHPPSAAGGAKPSASSGARPATAGAAPRSASPLEPAKKRGYVQLKKEGDEQFLERVLKEVRGRSRLLFLSRIIVYACM
jgi:hypothetical protein